MIHRSSARFSAALTCTFAIVLVATACGDDETSSASSNQGGAPGTGGNDTGVPDDSCVRPGDSGNDKGVGEFCTPTGNECAAFPEAGLCLASVGQDQWMCTRIGCDATTDCGSDAGCLITTQGSACVPCRCDDTGIGCVNGPMGGAGGTAGTGGAGGN